MPFGFNSHSSQMKNLLKGTPLPYQENSQFLHVYYNVSKYTPSLVRDLVSALWVPELEPDGFVWDPQAFYSVLSTVQLQNHYRKLQSDSATTLYNAIREKQREISPFFVTIFIIEQKTSSMRRKHTKEIIELFLFKIQMMLLILFNPLEHMLQIQNI